MSADKSNNSCLDIALPGYTLTEELGSGGYGEVWRATAPGGLSKAVKFVFGHYSDRRAAHELKALERIKEVRHPFLLSLERIEVLDDRLVIITEVADASLKDRFEECVAEGLPGIPRKELLGYLRDAADALDFLTAQHSLQHLDVKPENLLLLAGHIKVADFGLVKEVHNSQASLVGGLTPLYASPEVFQGRPTAFSDQYSLAVVYQEMLTGTLPFIGTSAAELTMAHLHKEPELSALPVADRYTLARALAKDGQQRFTTCSEFIDTLIDGGSQWHQSGAEQEEPQLPKGQQVPANVRASAPRPGPVTQVFDEVLGGGGKPVTPSILLDVPDRQPTVAAELPPLDVDANTFQAAPALVVGVGGEGCRILRQLRRQIVKRFGDSRNVPAVGLLLLDSDPKAILAATNGDRSCALRNDETLSLSLRRPQEYRDRSDRLQQWLSRRWLYNIPKSLNTEGLRPLGRLALIDHAKRTLQRIKLSLSAVLEQEAVAKSAETTGLTYLPNAARVYVVSSISGGAGGGAAIDLGYIVRSVLKKFDLEDAATVGVFTHAAGIDQRSNELSRVNAYSWLTEYAHATQPSFAYPGDAGAGLPGFPAGIPPFDNAYLARHEDGLDDKELEQAAEKVAEYLYLDVLSPAQLFFDACRQDALRESAPGDLRSFGLKRVAAASDQEIKQASATIAQHIIRSWSGKLDSPSGSGSKSQQKTASGGGNAEASSERDTNQLVHGGAQLIAKLQLNLDGIASTTREMMEARFEGNLERFYIRTLASLQETGKQVDVKLALEVADDYFAATKQSTRGESSHLLGHPLARMVGPLGLKLAGDLRRWVMEKLDDPQERLAGAKLGIDWLVDHFKAVSKDANRFAQRLTAEVLQAGRDIERAGKTQLDCSDPSNPQLERLLKYLRLRFDQCAVTAGDALASVLLSELKTTSETLIEFGRHLTHVASACVEAGKASTDAYGQATGKESALGDRVDAMVKACLGELASEVDLTTQKTYIAPHGGLFETVMSNARVRAGLLETLQDEAAAAVHRHLSQLNLLSGLLDEGESSTSLLSTMAEGANPKLLPYSHGIRRLAVLPHTELDDQQMEQLKEKVDGAALVMGRNVDFSLCTEAERIALADLALDIIDSRRDYAEFAARVQTRKDIRWKPLVQEPGSTQSMRTSVPVDVGESTPIATHMV